MRPLDDLKDDLLKAFAAPCNTRRMLFMSSCLRREYLAKLQSSPACMLPSYCHTLPTGQETGTFVALDIGGSTFRLAVVELCQRGGPNGGIKIKHLSVHHIDESTRRLCAPEFFEWMAVRVKAMLSTELPHLQTQDGVVPIGLAWSFPIDQTSNRSGRLQSMGKGFRCQDGFVGADIGALIESACLKEGVKVRIDAIINDSSATLLSQAYQDPTTSMSLILGTGFNAAVYLPVFSIGPEKFGVREPSWYARAEKVIVNTELSMFGKGILPPTRWDDQLNRNTSRPDFQPLEYMTTGRYLGEIFRLVLVEAVETCGLFDGRVPAALATAYSLDTALMAAVEADASPNHHVSARQVQAAFGLAEPPAVEELAFLRTTVEAISSRSTAFIATSLHALWSVQKATETNYNPSDRSFRTSVASNGSVVLKYPRFKARCQQHIANLVAADPAGDSFLSPEEIILEPTHEATVLGVAVAVAIADGT